MILRIGSEACNHAAICGAFWLFSQLASRHCEALSRGNLPCWDSLWDLLLVACHARTLCSLAMTRCFASLNMTMDIFCMRYFVIARGASLVAINRIKCSWTFDCFASLAMTQDYRFCIIFALQANNMRARQSHTSNIHGQPIDSLAMTFGNLHNATQLPTKTLMSHNATMARSKAAIISAIFMLFACIIDT